MKVIVVGGGKVGYYLAQTLMDHGHKPIIIERDKELCLHVANELDIPVINGDGTSPSLLEDADIQHADALIAVTGKDEDNLIACQLAKRRYKVGRTVARVNNPKNKKVMKELGVDIPVCSTDSIARLLEREVDTSAIKELIALNRGEVTLSELELPEDFTLAGMALSEIRLPVESVVVSITRGEEFIIPRGNTILQPKDRIIVIARNEVIHKLSEVLGLEERKR